jgi:rhodanese-related sulfurtransferase
MNLRHFLLISFLLSASLTNLSAQKNKSRIEILDNAAFDAKLLHIKGALIDLRSASEAEAGILPNARVIEWESDSFKKQVAALPHNQPVFLYCAGGYRSKQASEYFEKEGFTTIIILKDGFDLWLSEGYTVVDTNGKILQQKKSNRNPKSSTTYE